MNLRLIDSYGFETILMQSLLIGLSRWMHLNEYSQNWVASSPSPRESSPKASPSSSSDTPKLRPRDSSICFPEIVNMLFWICMEEYTKIIRVPLSTIVITFLSF